MTIYNRHKKTQITTYRHEMPFKQLKGSQITTFFLQNKPNLLNTPITITSFLTSNYEDFRPYSNSQNKPNQTQFQTQLKPKKPHFKPKQTQSNPIKPNFKPKNSMKNGFLPAQKL